LNFIHQQTEKSLCWYNHFAPLYDPLLRIIETSIFVYWRKLLWNKVEGKNILEVGVGTGLNFPFYPAETSITAVDNSESMLSKAREKARKQNLKVDLKLMNIQRMDFQDNSFDTVVSAMVFCAFNEPQEGLREVKRVVRSGGKIVMLEHCNSDKKWLASLINLINPLVAGLTGENFNRDTVYNVKASGLIVENVIRLSSIFRLIEARKERIFMLK